LPICRSTITAAVETCIVAAVIAEAVDLRAPGRQRLEGRWPSIGRKLGRPAIP
jgi:hypothetical protein